VEIGGEILTPRREIVSVPYAFRAADCDSLGGVSSDFYWTATNDGTGSGLDADKLDGFDAEAFSDTSHNHDDRYVHRDSLGTVGTVNAGDNPVDWTRLKGVPAGLADGVDDVGGAGDGYSLDAADGDPVDAVYVDGEGRVGIGTTSPEERLHLSGAAARILLEGSTADPEIDLAAVTDGPEDVWRVYKHGGTGALRFAQDGDRLSIAYQTGNVSIGTSSAGERLVVDGNISLSEHLKMEGAAVFSVDGTANTFLGRDAGFNNTGSSNTFVGEAAGYLNGWPMENVFVGDSTGFSNNQGFRNVFVGHSAGYSTTRGSYDTFVGARAGRANDQGHWNTFVGSDAGLGNIDGQSNTFVGADAGRANLGGSGNTYLGFAAGSANGEMNTCLGAYTDLWGGDGNVVIGYMAGLAQTISNKLLIANGPDSADVLIYGDFTTGNVGLGTEAPERKLHIKGTNPRILIEATSIAPEVNFKHTGDASSDVWAIYKEGTTEDLRFYQGGDKIAIKGGTGNVGIGSTNPGAYRLYVNGCAGGTDGWNSCSDLRFKKDIEDISGAVGKVMRLRGVSFMWRGDEYKSKDFDSRRHYGVIAQEAEEVLPEVVREGPDGEKGVAYTEIVPVLIEAIKTQQVRIDALEERIAELESSRR
jgi:hypothetical protein